MATYDAYKIPRTPAPKPVPNIEHSIAPPNVINAVRVLLGINGQRSTDRRESRRQARATLRLWLANIGAASPVEIARSIQKEDTNV